MKAEKDEIGKRGKMRWKILSNLKQKDDKAK